MLPKGFLMTYTVPYIDPARPKPRRRPLKAWHHMQKLIADKEDTEQVFHIIEALNGDSTRRDFLKFAATEKGAARLGERADLPSMLDNHEPLRALPPESVGRHYIAFMEREGLSAAGLVAESQKHRDYHQKFDDDYLWYMNRLRDTHDLDHVLTGYGRDALGEATLLGYSHGQHGGMGISFISFMGGRQVSKHVPKSARIGQVIKEGRENGKRAKPLVYENIEALLHEPIDQARERLGIAKPVKYRQALKVIEEAGIDYELVAA